MEASASAPSRILVKRPRRVPYALRERVEKSGRSPEEIVAEALASVPTFEEAADQLGVTVWTLRDWRTRYGIVVERAE